MIDGFPRSADNLAAWEAAAGANLRVAGVLCYDVDEAELSRRIVRRGSTSGRSDDQLHVLRQRFAVYREATLPVVDHYAACGKLWRINGARGVDGGRAAGRVEPLSFSWGCPKIGASSAFQVRPQGLQN